MRKTKLSTASGNSDIYVPGSISDLLKTLNPSSTILLVDSNVIRFHSASLEGFRIIDAGSGEESKSMENAAELLGKLINSELDRSSLLVGIGGGITTDLAGFVASVFLRGIRFGFVSTTLLGQVDAAIGGKNGVNYKGFKNLIGLIKQPDFVYCDIDSLRTLPFSEFRSGFAEIIKYAAIKRGDLFPYLNDNITKALAFDEEILEHLIFQSVVTKKQVVESDEFEKGERKFLNFGHTFAHALEKLYKISHGEAVAIGMILAARLSTNLGKLPASQLSDLESLITISGLPVKADMNTSDMVEVMRKDKKRKGESISFILLEEIGKAVIHDIPLKELNAVFNDLY